MYCSGVKCLNIRMVILLGVKLQHVKICMHILQGDSYMLHLILKLKLYWGGLIFTVNYRCFEITGLARIGTCRLLFDSARNNYCFRKQKCFYSIANQYPKSLSRKFLCYIVLSNCVPRVKKLFCKNASAQIFSDNILST